MKKNVKAILSLVFALVLVFQFSGAMAAADGVTGNEALLYEVYAPNPDNGGAMEKVTDENDLLGGLSCSVTLGDSALSPGGDGRVLRDLMENDLTITPPEGFAVAALCLRGGAEPGADAKGLPARLDPSSTRLTLEKKSFARETAEGEKRFNEDLLSFVGGEAYTLVIELMKLEDEAPINVVYPGDMTVTGKLGDSFKAQPAPEAPAGKEFSAWLLSYNNGASALLNPGDSFSPYTNCAVEPQWKEVLTITAKDPVEDESGSFITNGYEVSGALAQGDEITQVELSLVEDGSSYRVQPSNAVVSNGSENVTGNYSLQYVNSQPVEAKAAEEEQPEESTHDLTITAKAPVAQEDGSYKEDGYTHSGDLAEGDSISDVVCTVTEADGKAVSTPSGARILRGEEDVTAKYNITYVPAETVIPEKPETPEKVELTISFKSSVPYSGTDTFKTAYELSPADGLKEGDTLEVKFKPDGSLDSVAVSNPDNYTLTYDANAKVTVTATSDEVVLTAASKEKKYDGQPLTDPAVTATGLKPGDKLSDDTKAEGTITDPGQAKNEIKSYKIVNGDGTDVTSFYGNVKTVEGSLKVSGQTITISGSNITKNYGESYDVSTYGDAARSKGVDLKCHLEKNGSTVTNPSEPGNYDIMLDAVTVRDSNGTDVTATYSIVVKDSSGNVVSSEYKNSTVKIATLTIKEGSNFPLTVKPQAQSWTYDGASHSLDNTKVDVSGLQNGDSVTVSLHAEKDGKAVSSITDAGTYDIVIDKVTINGNAAKYKIDSSAKATLTVGKRPLTLAAKSAEKTYDGNAFKNYEVNATGLATDSSGKTIHSVTGVSVQIKDNKGNFIKNGPVNVGTYTKSVDVSGLKITDKSGNNVTANYDVKTTDGTLTIKQGITEQNNSTRPKTGDESRLGLWLTLLAVSALLILGIAAFLFFRNRKKQAEEVEQIVDASFEPVNEEPGPDAPENNENGIDE